MTRWLTVFLLLCSVSQARSNEIVLFAAGSLHGGFGLAIKFGNSPAAVGL
jgi:hypothetical protein